MGKVNSMTIGEETRARINALPYQNQTAKSIIRREGIVNLIKSKESGHLFATTELIKAAGFLFDSYKDKGYQAGSNVIQLMIKNGIIKRIPEPGTMKSAYAVIGDVKIKRPKRYKRAKTVTRKIEDLMPPKEEKANDKKSNSDISSVSPDLGDRLYSITFTIDKKANTEYGKKSIAKLELNETTLEIAGEMIKKTIEASK